MRRMAGAAVAAAAVWVGTARAARGQVLYIDDAFNRLGTVNVVTGAVNVIGSMGGDVITDIAFSPTGQLYGLSFSRLYRIDRSSAAVTLIGTHGIPGGNALVFGTDGTLYGAGASSTDLYRLDPTSGAATSLGSVGYASAGDLAFNAGSLYLSSSTDQLVRVTLGGTVGGTLVGDFGFSAVFGLATAANGVLYGVASTDIFAVNTATGVGTAVRDYRGAGLTGANGTSFFTEARPPAVMPEPSTWALLSTGLGGVGLVARRRKQGA